MKRVFLLLSLFCCASFCFTQSKEQLQKLKNYEESGYFAIDNGNIVVSKVIDSIGADKNEIYLRVKNYFTRAYGDANSVIQTDEKASGLIIGKGLYGNVYTHDYGLSGSIKYNAYHILRVDIKDGRVRIICSVSSMEAKGDISYKYDIVAYSPFTDKRIFGAYVYNKKHQVDAFFNLVEKMHTSIDSIEKSLKEGMLKSENEDW